MSRTTPIVVAGDLESTILELRGSRVILDHDLARAYGVPTRALVQAVKRNPERFPVDFAFHLEIREVAALRSQIVISKSRGGRRSLPWAFTEQGAAMAATVLNSPSAIAMSIHVVRAFVRTRRFLAEHAELARELKQLERNIAVKFGEYDEQLHAIFRTIERLISSPPAKSRKIGFRPTDE